MATRGSPIAVEHSPPGAVLIEPTHNPARLLGTNTDKRGNLSVSNYFSRWDCVDNYSNVIQKTHVATSYRRGVMRASSTLANGALAGSGRRRSPQFRDFVSRCEGRRVADVPMLVSDIAPAVVCATGRAS